MTDEDGTLALGCIRTTVSLPEFGTVRAGGEH